MSGGYSREDKLGHYAFYFGDPTNPEKIKDYSEHHAATLHFPDAYSGSNMKLRDTLTNLITSNVQSWCTMTALPWMRVQGLEVEWDENKFDVRLLQRVPYEGVSRLQTSIRRKHRERAVRRGIGMILESDFYMTPAGKKHFSDNLTSIQLCVQETVNFDGMYAYLTCPNHDFNYEMARGLVNKRSIVSALRDEIVNYAIVQKDERGFDRSIEMAKERMLRYHVEPNMLIVPPALMLYITTVPEARINYSIGGQQAVSEFQGGVAGFKSHSFRGLNVYTVTPFDVGDQQDAVQMLQRNSQVGEYYIAGPQRTGTYEKDEFADIKIYNEEKDKIEHITFGDMIAHSCIDEVWGSIEDNDNKKGSGSNNVQKDENFLQLRKSYAPGGGQGCVNTKNSMTSDKIKKLKDCSLFKSSTGVEYEQIVTQETKKWLEELPYIVSENTVEVKANKVNKFATCVGKHADDDGENGDDSPQPGRMMGNVYSSSFETVCAFGSTVRYNYHVLDHKALTEDGVRDQICDYLRNLDFRNDLTIRRLKKLADLGIYMHFKVCLTRPFIEHRMLSTVVTVAGNDTGCTLYGPADMQLSANTSTKVIEGHFTCHTKSIISKPDNVYVQRDIMASGYVAGKNTSFFSHKLNEAAHYLQRAKDVRTQMKVRLNFSHDHDLSSNHTEYESILPFACKFDAEEDLRDSAFNITARMMPWEVSTDSASSQKIFPGGGKLWKAYNHLYNMDRTILAGEDKHCVATRGFISGGSRNNGVVIQGPCRSNVESGTQSEWQLTPGQGHWGADNRPGDARWMRGEAIDMVSARRTMADMYDFKPGYNIGGHHM